LSQSRLGGKRRRAKCHLHKGGGQGKRRDKSTERGKRNRKGSVFI